MTFIVTLVGRTPLVVPDVTGTPLSVPLLDHMLISAVTLGELTKPPKLKSMSPTVPAMELVLTVMVKIGMALAEVAAANRANAAKTVTFKGRAFRSMVGKVPPLSPTRTAPRHFLSNLYCKD